MLHRVFSLDRVGDLGCVETVLFSRIDPASRMVETICLLTDMLAEVLEAIDAAEQIRCADASAGQFAAI